MDTNQILGVVVLYETKISNSITLRTINDAISSSEKLDIVVYDHSIQTIYQNNPFENLKLIHKHDPRNISIGKAYNFSAELATKMQKKWLLLLDQDTCFKSDLFDKYLSSIEEYPNESLFTPILKLQNEAIFSPCHYFFKRGFFLKKIKTGVHSLKYLSPVNSGILIKTEEFIKCGGYNEKIRLDFSDFQFIERIRQIRNTFVVIDSIGIQDFSDKIKDISKISNRFSIYCQSAKECEKKTFSDSFQYFIVVFLRSISLTLRTKRLIFIKIFIKNYIK